MGGRGGPGRCAGKFADVIGHVLRHKGDASSGPATVGTGCRTLLSRILPRARRIRGERASGAGFPFARCLNLQVQVRVARGRHPSKTPERSIRFGIEQTLRAPVQSSSPGIYSYPLALSIADGSMPPDLMPPRPIAWSMCDPAQQQTDDSIVGTVPECTAWSFIGSLFLNSFHIRRHSTALHDIGRIRPARSAGVVRITPKTRRTSMYENTLQCRPIKRSPLFACRPNSLDNHCYILTERGKGDRE
jgi:hypothetical protein